MMREPMEGYTVIIMGDSYSTFAGYIPQGYDSYYPGNSVPSVQSVEQTWWARLIKTCGMKLLMNDSWSGSTVSNTVRPGLPAHSSFLERMKSTFSGELKPDLIILFGGTNDSWLHNPHGAVKYEGWTEEDDRMTVPAFCHLFDYVCNHNPQARVLCVLNLPFDEEIEIGVPVACKKYGIECVCLHDIDKENGHPTALGMKQIAQQITDALQDGTTNI